MQLNDVNITKAELYREKVYNQTVIEVLDFLQKLGEDAESNRNGVKLDAICRIVDKLSD